MAAVTAISVWFVQTFDVAFSRRMSCSRARKRRDERAPIARVHRLADDAPGQAADLILGAREEPEVRAAEGERRPEGLALTDKDVGAPLARGLQDTGGDRIGAHDEQRAVRSAPATWRSLRSSSTPR